MPFGDILTEITIDDSQVVKILGPARTAQITAKYVRVLNKLGQLSVDAYQSKVPIDTGELRNYITILKRASSKDPVVQVGILGNFHKGRKNHPTFAPFLADILNIGISETTGKKLHRTQSSKAISPFSSIGAGSGTENWIRSARQAFSAAKGKYLSGLS